jgi:DNA-binding CsgD family transcriptional regulator
VVNLTVAFGGAAPQQQEMHRFIRDHPNRHFTVELSNGTSHIGRPVTRERPEPDFKFDSKGLCELLGLSPRQGRLTALLAEGQTLTSAAEEMGMTLSTARWHLREIFRKTNSHSQGELINLARAASPPEPSKDRASGP